MIDSTKGTAASTAQTAAAEAPRPVAAQPFRVWLGVSGNGEDAYVPPAPWGGYQAGVVGVETPGQVAAPPRPVTTAAASSGTVTAPPSLDALALPDEADATAATSATAAAAAYAAAPQATSEPPPQVAPQVASLPPAAQALPDDFVSFTATSNGEQPFIPPKFDSQVHNGNATLFAEGPEPTIWDLLDFINPLQHIPIVNLIYREITGDKIGALPQIVGGAVLGGPVGAAFAVANVITQEATGKDIGGNVLAMFDDEAAPETRLADTPAQQPGKGGIDVIAPTPESVAAPTPGGGAAPSANFVPYSAVPPGLLPEATIVRTPKPKAEAGDEPQPSPEAVRRAAEAQGLEATDHPLLAAAAAGEEKPASRRRPVSAGDSVQPQTGGNADFVAKFMAAMDKYDKAGRLTSDKATEED